MTFAMGKTSFDGPECIKEVKLLCHNMIIGVLWRLLSMIIWTSCQPAIDEHGNTRDQNAIMKAHMRMAPRNNVF